MDDIPYHPDGSESVDAISSHRQRALDDEYVLPVAKPSEEIKQLIDAGSDYVCPTPENLILFKSENEGIRCRCGGWDPHPYLPVKYPLMLFNWIT